MTLSSTRRFETGPSGTIHLPLTGDRQLRRRWTVAFNLRAIFSTASLPAATLNTSSYTASLLTPVTLMSLISRKTAVASHPSRLFPSTRGWFFTSD